MGKRRGKLTLGEEERAELSELAGARKTARRVWQRATIMLMYERGERIARIMKATGLSRPSVGLWIDRALALGAMAALKDIRHGAEAKISAEAKSWVVHLACTQPKTLGLAAEVWSRQSLAQYVRENAAQAGHPSLGRAVKATVQRILEAQQLRPEKVRYYLERRDPHFEMKMREVLVVYKEVEMQNQRAGESCALEVTLSVDEKPGVQAIANTAPDLPPVPGAHPCLGRDHEYKRLGTCSILAALDLHNGHVIARVSRRHRSREFIELLREIDASYPAAVSIRLILDNHSAHLSKETRAWLATRPNRFKFVHTPTHGSWLNLVETLFGKMSRSFLRNIRVASWEELRERILKGVAEINAAPVVHRWQKFDLFNE